MVFIHRISRNFNTGPKSTHFQFPKRIRIKYQVEKYISAKNNKLETFYEK